MKKQYAHWATPEEVKSGIKYKTIDGAHYIMRVGIKTINGDYESAWKWYLADWRDIAENK
jgi:hypothetical protein